MNERALIQQMPEPVAIFRADEDGGFVELIAYQGQPIEDGAKLYTAAPQPTELTEPDNDEVICPNCVTQFRAIPVNVQQLMLDAGFEPPFTAAPQPTDPADDDLTIAYMAGYHKGKTDAQPTEPTGEFESLLARAEAEPHASPNLVNACRTARAVLAAQGAKKWN